MTELEILDYQIRKHRDRVDWLEERHDKQIMILESEVARLKADLAAVVERLLKAQAAPEE
jgi:hypothetical protein